MMTSRVSASTVLCVYYRDKHVLAEDDKKALCQLLAKLHMPEEVDETGSEEAGPSKRGKVMGGTAKRGPRAGRGRGKLMTPPGDVNESPRVRRSNRLGAQNGVAGVLHG